MIQSKTGFPKTLAIFRFFTCKTGCIRQAAGAAGCRPVHAERRGKRRRYRDLRGRLVTRELRRGSLTGGRGSESPWNRAFQGGSAYWEAETEGETGEYESVSQKSGRARPGAGQNPKRPLIRPNSGCLARHKILGRPLRRPY